MHRPIKHLYSTAYIICILYKPYISIYIYHISHIHIPYMSHIYITIRCTYTFIYILYTYYIACTYLIRTLYMCKYIYHYDRLLDLCLYQMRLRVGWMWHAPLWRQRQVLRSRCHPLSAGVALASDMRTARFSAAALPIVCFVPERGYGWVPRDEYPNRASEASLGWVLPWCTGACLQGTSRWPSGQRTRGGLRFRTSGHIALDMETLWNWRC